jgi:hypothetical protein
MRSKKFAAAALPGVLALVSAFSTACFPGKWTGIVMGDIVIAAPPEKVFAYMDDPENYAEFLLGLKGTKCDGSGLDRTCRMTMEIWNKSYEGRMLIVDYAPDHRQALVLQTDNGDLALKFTFLCSSQPQGTRLVILNEILYARIPPGLSGLSHATIQAKINERLNEELTLIRTAVEKKQP